MRAPNAALKLSYRVAPVHDAWVLSEESMPESRDHDPTTELLRELLRAWALRSARNIQVGRNLAVRWDEANRGTGWTLTCTSSSRHRRKNAPPRTQRSLGLRSSKPS